MGGRGKYSSEVDRLNYCGNIPTWILKAGIPLLVCFLILAAVNVLFLKLIFIYGRKRKFGPAGVIIVGMLIINLLFLFTSESKISRAGEPSSNVSLVSMQTRPASRQYSFIKFHTIYRDDNWGTIAAVDSEDYVITLMKEEPRQIYQEAFQVLMEKENFQFKGEKEAYDYATFLILIYYFESEPVYLESEADFMKMLKLRKDTALHEIIGRRGIENPVKNVTDPPIPGEYDWDIDGNHFTFSDPESDKIMKRIGKPDFIRSYDDALNFRLYTFSLRYRELVEWQFKVFKNGEILVKKLNVITCR
jgi:uncharacterized integral membrane protein